MVINNDNGKSKFFTGVYLWMFIGLVLSGAVAYFTSTTPAMINFVRNGFFAIVILELIVVIAFTALRNKISSTVAKVLFIIYSIVSGLTLSSIFLYYKFGSVVMVFLSAALLFGLMAVYGYLTKQDLSSFGRLMLFGLIAVIILSIINMFVLNSALGLVASIISIIVFLGFTAWDMKKLRSVYEYYVGNEEELNKAAIYGALDLYLDFVNIFLDLLRLFGKSRD